MLEIKKELSQSLKNIGLDRAEIQVFILLLKQGFLNIQDITNKIKLPRSSITLACNNLIKNGVIKFSMTGKRKFFYIENPKDLFKFIEQEENIIASKKLSVERILPEIQALQAINKGTEKIIINEFEGEDGLVDIFNQSLNQPKHSYVYRFGGDPGKFTIAREKLVEYRKKRVKSAIITKLLQPESDSAQEEKKDALKKMREVKILPLNIYNPDINASVWGNKFAMTVWDQGLHSVVIENKAFANFMKQLFDIAWEKGK